MSSKMAVVLSIITKLSEFTMITIIKENWRRNCKRKPLCVYEVPQFKNKAGKL